MRYHDFKECHLSALGLGCMRLPVLNEKDDQIDVVKTEEIVDYALKHGINYFDTAWRYHSGNSETVMGQILSKYPRGSYYLATKFPGFSPEMFENGRTIFQEQLQKCRVDYFDFYLLHNVAEKNIDRFISPEYGIVEYLIQQKHLGKIRHLGFSTHGSLHTIRRFLDAYGSELEFCQIQLNYLDWQLQNAKAKVELIRSYGLDVWVMEPVRGGRLATLPEETMQRLRKYRPNETAPGWAFRFLQTVPGIKMILSGMSNDEQMDDNINTFTSFEPLSDKEMKLIGKVNDIMFNAPLVGCTACRYCCDGCPSGIEIPDIFKTLNTVRLYGDEWRASLFYRALIERSGKAKDCIGCGQCESVCPQHLPIIELLAEASERLDK